MSVDLTFARKVRLTIASVLTKNDEAATTLKEWKLTFRQSLPGVSGSGVGYRAVLYRQSRVSMTLCSSGQLQHVGFVTFAGTPQARGLTLDAGIIIVILVAAVLKIDLLAK